MSEQQQVLQLAKKITKQDSKQDLASQKEKDDLDNLDLFIGLVSPINDPFNVFFRLSDIQNSDSTLIYFYTYSLGKAKVILWGVYDVTTNEFLIDSSCKYNVEFLAETIKIWKRNKYDFVASEMRDRATGRIGRDSIFDDTAFRGRNNATKLYQTFQSFFLYTRFQNRELLDADHNPLHHDSLNENMQRMLFELAERDSVNGDVTDEYHDIQANIIKMTETIIADKRTDFAIVRIEAAENLKPLFLQHLTKKDSDFVLMIHTFVLLMMDLEEYRSAKYIITLYGPQPVKNQKSKSIGNDAKYTLMMERYLNGSFTNHWINKLVDVIGPIEDVDPLEIKIKIASDMVNIMEDDMNIKSVGVIGGPKFEAKLNRRITTISDLFKRFLEKSPYSKQSFVANLQTCYVPKDCEYNDNLGQNLNGNSDDEATCGVYEHGNKLSSSYDHT